MRRTGTGPLRDDLLRLELALARRDAAAIGMPLGDLLADDFVELGASGRVWTAAAMRHALAAEEPADREIEAFEIAVLAPDLVLATYRTGPPRPANRASIWVRRSGRWQLRFHQGTPIGPAST